MSENVDNRLRTIQAELIALQAMKIALLEAEVAELKIRLAKNAGREGRAGERRAQADVLGGDEDGSTGTTGNARDAGAMALPVLRSNVGRSV